VKIERSQHVTRYYVLFEHREVMILRHIGQLPPHGLIPAPMWLTEEELVETLRMLGYVNPEKQTRALIEDWAHGG